MGYTDATLCNFVHFITDHETTVGMAELDNCPILVSRFQVQIRGDHVTHTSSVGHLADLPAGEYKCQCCGYVKINTLILLKQSPKVTSNI